MMRATDRSTRVIDANFLRITRKIELFATAFVSAARHDLFSLILSFVNVGGVGRLVVMSSLISA